MRESTTRRFFSLAYERIGTILLWGLLRCLPWLIPLLLVTFLPQSALPGGRYAALLAAVGLAALLIAPALTGGVHHATAAIVAGDDPVGRALFAGCGRRYPPLLAGAAFQLLLTATIVHNLYLAFGPPGVPMGFVDLLALGSCGWLLLMCRLWSFYFLPLLFTLDDTLRGTARATLILLLEEPARTLGRFGLRQMLGGLVILSGLGPFLALGSLLPLYSAVAARAALRRHLGEEDEENEDAASPPRARSFRQWLRPWE